MLIERRGGGTRPSARLCDNAWAGQLVRGRGGSRGAPWGGDYEEDIILHAAC